MNPLADHFPAGCWRQPDDGYAGQCSCGHAFHGPTHAAAKKAWANHAAPPVEGLTSGEGDTVPLYSFDEAWDELVNKDDRTSPEEYPDMCLITREELRCYMEARQYACAASPAQPLTAGGLFACRFDGVDYSRADLQIAQRAACAIVPLYGTGDHGEQEAAQAGKLWNDHPAVQGALRALHEARVGTAPDGALEAIDRFVTDHVGNDDTPEGIEVDQRAQEAVAVLRAMLAASPKATATASERYSDEDEALYTRWLAGDETLPTLPREKHLRFQARVDRETKESAR